MNLFELCAKLSLDKSDYDKGVDDAEKKGSSLGDKISGGMKTAAKVTGAAVTAAAAGVGVLAKSAITAGTNFETAFAQVETIMDTTQMSTDAMSAGLLELSNAMGISTDELSGTVYNAISATGDTANALALAETASKLATAGFTDSASALSVLTTSMNAYGLSAEEAESISDSLIQVQNLGVTTVSELASSMGKAIASASAYGVDLGNVESAYVSMTKAGISTAESTTYMAGMMKELGSDSSDVAEIIKGQTGKTFAELMADGASLADVLGILNDSVDGDSSALMNLWGSAEAGKAANAILSQGLDNFNSNLETITQTSGGTAKAFSTMENTMSKKMEKAKNSWTNMMAAIASGDDISTYVDDFVENSSSLVESLMPTIETALMGIGSLVEKLAPVIAEKLPALVVSLLPSFITTISSLIDGILVAMPDLLVALSDALPGLIDVCIATLTENLPTLLTVAADAIITIADGLAASLPELIPVLIDTMLYIVNQITQPDRLAMLIEAAVKIIVALVTGLVAAIPKIIEAIPQIIKNIINAFKQAWPQIKQSGIELFSKLGAGFTQIMQSISKICTDVYNKIKEKFNEKKQAMIGIGQNLFNGLTQGIGNAVGAVIQKVTGVASSIVTAVKKLLGIHSPSKVFAGIGGFLMEGLEHGIEDNAIDAISAAESAAEDITNAMDLSSAANGRYEADINNPSNIVFQIYGAEGQDVNELAELVSEKIANAYGRQRAVYA